MMDTETLTPGQLALLREIGECAAPMSGAIPLACLCVLLRLDYIEAEGDGYVLTPSGLFRAASDF